MTRFPRLARLTAKLRLFRRREDGNAVFELVLVLPIMMTIFMMATESAYLMTRQIMLERATDLVVRDIRLGRMANATPAAMKQAICDRSVILMNCTSSLALNMVKVSKTTWNLPTGAFPCVDRLEDIDPSNIVNPNMPSDMLVLRACIIQDAIFPGTGIGLRLKQANGDEGYKLVALSAFVNEP